VKWDDEPARGLVRAGHGANRFGAFGDRVRLFLIQVSRCEDRAV